MPANIKTNLSNVKSVLRSKRRKKKAARAEPEQAAVVAGQPTQETRQPVTSMAGEGGALEELELQIDECLTHARRLDREGLGEVIDLLRRARNGVVWKIGQ